MVDETPHEAILESLPTGVIAIDRQGIITYINPACAGLLGWRSDQVRGKPLTDILVHVKNGAGDVLPQEDIPLLQTLRQVKSTSAALFYHRKNGHKFPVTTTASPIIGHGKLIGAVEVFRDSTKEHRREVARTEFVSVASHQLRTPLGIAKWYLNALRRDSSLKNTPKTTRDYLDAIYANNERVIALVRNLLSVSRIEQGNIKNEPRQTSIVDTIERVVNEMQVVAAKKHITLSFTNASQLTPKRFIDPLRLHEVIGNLVANAIAYTPAGGSVMVRLRAHKQKFSIVVADTGTGIEPADQRQLFSKFFRTATALRSNPDGTGLGLYLVKSYVEAWGGKITVLSHPGRGSTFTVTLPLGGRQE